MVITPTNFLTRPDNGNLKSIRIVSGMKFNPDTRPGLRVKPHMYDLRGRAWLF